jgi:hypothetical protein
MELGRPSSFEVSARRFVLVVLALVTCMALLACQALAQDVGTVKNGNGSTTTTERDSRYGNGVKSTTRDENGRVTLEEWKGAKKTDAKGNIKTDANGEPMRDTLETTSTAVRSEGTTVTTKRYNPVNDNQVVTVDEITKDALGGIVDEKHEMFDDKGQRTKGTKTAVSPAGSKTTQNWNPSSHRWEELKPIKEEETKKVVPMKKEAGEGEEQERVPLGRYISPGRVDFSVGYAYMHAPDEMPKTLNGVNASLFYNFTPHIGFGVDVTDEYGSVSTTFDTSFHRYLYLGGPQIRIHASDKVNISVHAFAGEVYDTTKVTFGAVSTSTSAHAFAMAGGGGVDVRVGPSISIRPIHVDYVRTHFGGRWQDNILLSAGLVFHIGRL